VLQRQLVPVCAGQQTSVSVAVTLAGQQTTSTMSSVNSAAGLSRSSAAAARHYSSISQSVQSDNSFDAEYGDVEPDSSPGSVTNEDDADLSASATCMTTAVSGCSTDPFSSSSHSVHAWSSSTESTTTLLQPPVVVDTSRPSIITIDSNIRTSLPIFSSTRTDLLPKSTFALTCEKFPSPVKHNSDVFNRVLPLPTTDSLIDYNAPVMAAESSTRCFRFIPATAAALCDTSTVSSPSFARSLCSAISATTNRPQIQPSVSESSAIDRQICSTSVSNFVSGLVQHNTIVTSSTPVMADVLQAQLDQGSLYQLSAAGLPFMRTARLADNAELLNALMSQAQSGNSKPEAMAGVTGRQQAQPNDLTVPVIAFLNLGAGTGSLPSFSCAAVLPPGALQFLKLSVSNESISSSVANGTVSSADQAGLL